MLVGRLDEGWNVMDWTETLKAMQRGRTQQKTADDLGISQAALSKLLNGKRLGRKVAAALVRRHPELRDVVCDELLKEGQQL